MNTKELKNWVIKNNIEADTLSGFEYAFKNYREDFNEEFTEHFEGFDKRKLKINFYKVALTIIDWGDTDSEDCVITFARLEYNEEYTGEYKRVYSLSGECIDDYLLIE